MDNKIVLMAVVAIVLGMLVANMFKEVCGCKVVEGQCPPADGTQGLQCKWVGGTDEVQSCPYSLASFGTDTVRDPCTLMEGDGSRDQVQIVPAAGGESSLYYPNMVDASQSDVPGGGQWYLSTCCGWRPAGAGTGSGTSTTSAGDQIGCSGDEPIGKQCTWAGNPGNSSCPYSIADGTDPCLNPFDTDSITFEGEGRSGNPSEFSAPNGGAWWQSDCCSWQDTTATSSNRPSSQVSQSGTGTGSGTSTTSSGEITATEPSFVLRDGCIVPSASEGSGEVTMCPGDRRCINPEPLQGDLACNAGALGTINNCNICADDAHFSYGGDYRCARCCIQGGSG